MTLNNERRVLKYEIIYSCELGIKERDRRHGQHRNGDNKASRAKHYLPAVPDKFPSQYRQKYQPYTHKYTFTNVKTGSQIQAF